MYKNVIRCISIVPFRIQVEIQRMDILTQYYFEVSQSRKKKTLKKKKLNSANSQEYRLKYWATRSSVHSFSRTAHSFACSGLLALLTPSAALTRSLARSLRSLPHFSHSHARGTVNEWMAILSVFFSIFDHSASVLASCTHGPPSAAGSDSRS